MTERVSQHADSRDRQLARIEAELVAAVDAAQAAGGEP